jgi:hypothetical protein
MDFVMVFSGVVIALIILYVLTKGLGLSWEK